MIAQLHISDLLFYLFAVTTGISALAVVISRNIVRTAVALLFTLVGVAGLYFLLQAEFLAAVQLVVYAGGTLILIVFAVMLTSKSPFSRFQPKRVEVMVAAAVGGVLLISLVLGIISVAGTLPHSAPISGQLYPIDEMGVSLLGDYLAPFEIVSVLLLVVMIGAAYLAKARRRDSDELLLPTNAELSRRAR